MKLILATIFLSTLLSCTANKGINSDPKDDSTLQANQVTNQYVGLSMEFVELLKEEKDVSDVLSRLASIKLDDLAASLDSKNKKLAFWINIYNAFVQYELVRDPDSFKDKDTFYKGQRHNIAGIKMSYDNIEHGILRNSRIKLSLGYIKRLSVDDWEKKLRNEDIDGRIHFALNCGAKSCPPVAIFDNVGLDKQMNAVVTQYLNNYTKIEGETVKTSPLFSWFRGDFGGKRGVLPFLRTFGVVPDNGKKYSVEFTDYDWTLSTGNFTDL